MGKFTEDELVEILNKYGTLSDNGEETILDKTLTTTDKLHEIKVSEIWDVPFEKKKEIVKCMIAGDELSFVEGTVWNYDFLKSELEDRKYCEYFFETYKSR